jgi:hypothetical protein
MTDGDCEVIAIWMDTARNALGQRCGISVNLAVAILRVADTSASSKPIDYRQ